MNQQDCRQIALMVHRWLVAGWNEKTEGGRIFLKTERWREKHDLKQQHVVQFCQLMLTRVETH